MLLISLNSLNIIFVPHRQIDVYLTAIRLLIIIIDF